MGSMNLKVNEPSMEDVLASIRRIISDDHEPASAFSDAPPSPLTTVLEITEKHVSPGFYPEPLPQREFGAEEELLASGVSYDEACSIARLAESREALASLAKAAAVQAIPQPRECDPGESLMSRATEASVADAFGRLGAARVASQPQTVEDLMKEMLRPMLKAWLDENLPALVERLVKAEIERVTRG